MYYAYKKVIDMKLAKSNHPNILVQKLAKETKNHFREFNGYLVMYLTRLEKKLLEECSA